MLTMKTYAASSELLPRRYAQSTSGRNVSHLTEPPDSRSIFIQRLSPARL